MHLVVTSFFQPIPHSSPKSTLIYTLLISYAIPLFLIPSINIPSVLSYHKREASTEAHRQTSHQTRTIQTTKPSAQTDTLLKHPKFLVSSSLCVCLFVCLFVGLFVGFPSSFAFHSRLEVSDAAARLRQDAFVCSLFCFVLFLVWHVSCLAVCLPACLCLSACPFVFSTKLLFTTLVTASF